MNGAVGAVPSSLLALDLAGTFAFALNGGLIAVRTARVDVVGVVSLAMITALGGGVIRDVMLGDLPPASFDDWRYLVVALVAGLFAFAASARMERLATPIVVFDALGLSFFAIIGATKALELGLGALQATILGAITGVGGGTVRDVLLRRIPTVLTSGLYAIPALVGAGLTVAFFRAGLDGLATGVLAAGVCFVVRMIGVRYDLHAPMPRAAAGPPDETTVSDRT